MGGRVVLAGCVCSTLALIGCGGAQAGPERTFAPEAIPPASPAPRASVTLRLPASVVGGEPLIARLEGEWSGERSPSVPGTPDRDVVLRTLFEIVDEWGVQRVKDCRNRLQEKERTIVASVRLDNCLRLPPGEYWITARFLQHWTLSYSHLVIETPSPRRCVDVFGRATPETTAARCEPSMSAQLGRRAAESFAGRRPTVMRSFADAHRAEDDRQPLGRGLLRATTAAAYDRSQE